MLTDDGGRNTPRRSSRDSLRKKLHWLAVVLYMGSMFHLSSQSHTPNLERYGVKDWMEHGAEYVVLGAIAAKAAAVTWPWSAGACGGFAVILGTGYGLSDEIHQRLVPGRKCDARDWSADVAGSALGALVFLIWNRFAKRRRSNV